MVTHSEHDARYAHRVVRLLDGQVVLEHAHL
jgi:putative ABC transport system ATP-binding protein